MAPDRRYLAVLSGLIFPFVLGCNGYESSRAVASDSASNSESQIPGSTPAPNATPVPISTPVPSSADHAPVVRLSVDGKRIAKPVIGQRAVDYVESGLAYSLQGVVVSESAISSFAWTQLSGPSIVTFESKWANRDYAGIRIRNFTHGTYAFKLEVTDDRGRKGSDIVKLTFPVYGQLAGRALVSLQNSSDEFWLAAETSRTYVESSGALGFSVARHAGTMRDYNIRQIAGPSLVSFEYKDPRYSNVISAKVSNITYGTYTFEATVTSDQGETATEVFDVILVKPFDARDHSPPNPVVNPILTAESHGEIVVATIDGARPTTLVSSAEVVADSLPRDFNVRQIAGPTALNCYNKVFEAGHVTCFANNVDFGTYTFEFSVMDETGRIHQVTSRMTYPKPLSATSTNQAPQVTLSSQKEIVVPVPESKRYVEDGREFWHQGVVYDDGAIASYKWTQISGPTQLKMTRQSGISSPYFGIGFTNCAYGSYELQLEVIDDHGARATKNVVFTFQR